MKCLFALGLVHLVDENCRMLVNVACWNLQALFLLVLYTLTRDNAVVSVISVASLTIITVMDA